MFSLVFASCVGAEYTNYGKKGSQLPLPLSDVIDILLEKCIKKCLHSHAAAAAGGGGGRGVGVGVGVAVVAVLVVVGRGGGGDSSGGGPGGPDPVEPS